MIVISFTRRLHLRCSQSNKCVFFIILFIISSRGIANYVVIVTLELN